MFNVILSKLIEPVLGIFTDTPEVKQVKQEAKIETIKANKELKIAKLKSKTKITEESLTLDQQILQIRRNSWLDEIVILLILTPAVAVFFPPAQPYIANGFTILNSLPGFYQALLVLVVVMVVGGVGLIRDLLQSFSLKGSTK